MNKKVVSVILLSLVLSSLVIGSVSALSVTEALSQIGNSVKNILEPVIKFLIGGGTNETLTGELLFTRVLLFILMLGIIWNALDRVPFFKKQRAVLNITTFVVSLLAIRGMASSEIIENILLPYTALGIALSAGIPFVIYFITVNLNFNDEDQSIFRRIAWALFAVIFMGLYFMRFEKLGDFAYIYPVTALIAFVMAIMDGSISRFFRKHEVKKLKNLFKHEQVLGIRRRIRNLKEDIAEGDGNPETIKKLIDHLEDKIKSLEKTK